MISSPAEGYELNDPQRGVRVLAGSLHAFVVMPGDVAPVRHALVTLLAGDAILGATPIGGAYLIAVGSAGASVEPLDDAEMTEAQFERLAAAVARSLPAFAVIPGTSHETFGCDMLRAAVASASAADAEASRRIVSTEVESESALSSSMRALEHVLDARKSGAERTTGSTHPVVTAFAAALDAADVTPPKRPFRVAEAQADLEGMVASLARAARTRVRPIRLEPDWWKVDSGVLVGAVGATPDDAVALIPTHSGYDVVFGKDGSRRRLDKATALNVAERAYALSRPLPRKRLGVTQLLAAGLHGSSRDLVGLAVYGLAGAVLAALTPLATGLLFGKLAPQGDARGVSLVAAALCAAALSAGVFHFVGAVSMQRIQTRFDISTQPALWDRILDLPASFFKEYSVGDLATRILGIDSLRTLLSTTTISTLLGGIFAAVSLFVIFAYEPRLACVALVLGICAIVVPLAFGMRRLRYARTLAMMKGQTLAFSLQLIIGIAKLRTAGAEPRALSEWMRRIARQRHAEIRSAQLDAMSSAFVLAWPALSLFAIIFFIVAVLHGTTSVTAFIIFASAYAQFLVATTAAASNVAELIQAVPLLERLEPLIATVPEVDENRSDPGELTGEIELSRVTFSYTPGAPPAVSDLSLHILPGEFVALVGPSGSGKSSILRLLLGFEQPESGAILYNKRDIATLDLIEARRQIGVVLQDSQVLPGTIYENIVSNGREKDEDVWEAARVAGFDEVIRALPMGMQTIITPSNFSGGQLQRLRIARALVRKPRIVFFDEATSALDNRTQAHVTRCLQEINATRLVVAHRLSTVINADRIVVIVEGRIVQQGTYDELMLLPGTFRDLASRQLVA